MVRAEQRLLFVDGVECKVEVTKKHEVTFWLVEDEIIYEIYDDKFGDHISFTDIDVWDELR